MPSSGPLESVRGTLYSVRTAKQRRDLDSPWKETLQGFLRPLPTFFFPRFADAIDWERGYVALKT